MRNAASHFDWIFIDCPPGIGLVTTGALAASDYVIIPVQSEPLSLRTLPQLLRQLIAVKTNHEVPLEIAGILLTMLDAEDDASDMVARQMRECFDPELIFATEIPRDPSINLLFSGHENVGTVLPDIAERSTAIRAYQKLAKEIENKYRTQRVPVLHERLV